MPFYKHLNWLLGPPMRNPGGLLAAWLDESVPGYPYQEATGYLLTLLCYLHQLTGESRFRGEAERCAEALANSIASMGGCGRDGKIYLFDTAVCLRSLETFLKPFPDLEAKAPREQAKKSAELVRDMLQTGTAFLGPRRRTGENRWSESFTVHLIKAVASIGPWLPETKEAEQYGEAVEKFMTGNYRDGLLYADPSNDTVYLHAHCYAVEGLLALEAQAGRRDQQLPQIIDKLAEMQNAAGALPRSWPAGDESCLATDTTAQAVRIWQCADAQKYRDNIARGLDFLESMAHPEGGFAYSSDVGHRNSWTTIFAIQAMLWRDHPAEAAWII